MDYSVYPRHDVLCIDMRSFYASVEAVKRGLDPMSTMLAVVGDKNRNGSIVLAASPALKEKYSISNVSRYYELPDDENIHVVQAQMADYVRVSVEITRFLFKYVPKYAIHPYSIDETWLTVNGLDKLIGTPWEIAALIKEDILDEFGLTCSVGIGDNKFLAKVVVDVHAKTTGIAECRYEDVEEKLWPFPVEDMWGIGSRMKNNLNSMGIIKIKQLANFPLDLLKKRFGVMGEQLYWHAWGIDLSPVYGDFIKRNQKGFGRGVTLLRDYSGKDIAVCILELSEEVCRQARGHQQVGKTISLGIGYSSHTGGGFNRSHSIQEPTNMTMQVYDVCMKLFNQFYDGHSKIRRVNVTLNNLSADSELQLNLFEDRTKENDLSVTMDMIREKFGPAAILRASSYTEAGIALDQSKKIGGHNA